MSTAEGLLRRGEIRALRLRRCVLIEIDEVDRYIAALRSAQYGAAR